MGSFSETWITERRVRRVFLSWRVDRAALLFCQELSRRSVEYRAPNDPDVGWVMYLSAPTYPKQHKMLELPKKVHLSVRYYSRYDPFLYMRPFLCPIEQELVQTSRESEDYKFLLEKEQIYNLSRGVRVVIDSKHIDPNLEYLDIKLTLVYMGRLLRPRRISVPVRTLGQPPVGLAADLEKLLSPDTDILADVTIYVEEKELRAHRAILSARSPVFQAMFRSDMTETTTGRVTLSDIKAEAVSAMLQYMYSGRVHPVTCSIAELLAAADRYSITDLKDACEAELIAGLSVETAYEALCLNERYNCPKLKTQALSVLRENILDAIRTTWWDNMTKNEPHILTDIIESNRKSTDTF